MNDETIEVETTSTIINTPEGDIEIPNVQQLKWLIFKDKIINVNEIKYLTLNEKTFTITFKDNTKMEIFPTVDLKISWGALQKAFTYG